MVVRHNDHDSEPVYAEVEVANIDRDDGHAWVRLQATRARAIAARFQPEATPERIAAGLGTVMLHPMDESVTESIVAPHEAAPESIAAGLETVMSHPVDYPEAYASVTVLLPTMVAWLADTFSLNGQAHTTPMTYNRKPRG